MTQITLDAIPAPLPKFTALLEKVVLTFIEVFITAWLASGAIGFDGWQQFTLAGIAAAGTAVANGTPEASNLPFYIDLLYRVARTYAVGFLTFFGGPLAMGLSVDGLQAAAWAALPAAVTIVKALLATRVGQQGTGALLPARFDTPPAFALPPVGSSD